VLYCIVYNWCGCLFCWVLCVLLSFTVGAIVLLGCVLTMSFLSSNNLNNNFNNNLHSTLFFPQMRGCETGGHHL
jgi:hypothetical protein